ncbi:MAG: nucleotidyltransferase family protein [Acidobacteria bacterium]|nr:nucleotidyltransferase family protein [Acidobacteriota bacterium]
MNRSREEILEVLQANRDKIRSFGVRKLGLFGSYSRNEATGTSDIDLVVDFEKKTFDAYMDLKEFLERLFHCRVDLVIADAVKPRLRAAIVDAAVYAPGL